MRNLSIELNHLISLDEVLFSSNTKLVNVWLNGNKISVLSPKVFEGLSNLVYIDLNDNDCIDGFFEPTTFDEMEKSLQENCSSSTTVIHRTFRKYKVRTGDDEQNIEIRNEYDGVDPNETLMTIVQDVAVSEFDEATESTTKGSPIKNKPEDKTVACELGDTYWRFSESNLRTCMISDQTIDAKGFKIADNVDDGKTISFSAYFI